MDRVRAAAGWLLWAAGVALALGAFWYVGWGGLFAGDPAFWQIFGVFLAMPAGAALAHAGQRVRLTARRRRATIGSVPADGELFVLYLRGFRQDAARSGLERGWARPDALQPALNVGSLFLSGRSLEEHLIAAVRPLGRVIAVGRPGEQLPPAGAQRLFLPVDAWRQPVRRMMTRARLVVIFLDPSPSTLWEFAEAARLVPPERLLLVAPARRQTYEHFRAEATGLALPDFVPSQVHPDAPGGLIHYSAAREPTFSPIEVSPMYAVLGPAVRVAARPALAQLAAYEAARSPEELTWRVMVLQRLRRRSWAYLLVIMGVTLLTTTGWWWPPVVVLCGLVNYAILTRLIRKAERLAVPIPGRP